MAKYKITEDNLQNIISESVTRFLAEAKNDESIGGWLGKQAGKLGKWANDNVNDYRSNKQKYKQGQTSSAETSTQPQNAEPQSNTGNQITLQDIEQAITQLNQQFAQLKGENPTQSDTPQQATSSQEKQDTTNSDNKESQENQNTEENIQTLYKQLVEKINDGQSKGLTFDQKTWTFSNPDNKQVDFDINEFNALKQKYKNLYEKTKGTYNSEEKYNNEGPETKKMIEKGIESGLGYDEKNKQFTNSHNLLNVDLNKWNQELKDAIAKDSTDSNSNTQQNNQNIETPEQQTSNSAYNDLASKSRMQMNRAVNPMYWQDGHEDVNDGKINNKPVIAEDKLEKIISESIKRYLKAMK